MEKTLLRRKTVLENGIIINKWFCSKKIKKANPTLTLKEGWNIEADGECSPACPPGDSHGYYVCQGGQCVYIPL